MSQEREKTRMRQTGTAATSALIMSAALLALTLTPANAEVEVDLSAIGARTDADARIATGKAPVQLRFPGETPSTRILLTPPPSLRQAQDTAQELPQTPPKLLGPSDATVVEIEPEAEQPIASTPPALVPPQRTALPTTAPVTPAPSAPVERAARDGSSVSPSTAALVPQTPVTPRALDVVTPPVSTGAPETAADAQPVQIASLPSPKSAAHRLGFEGGTADILGATRDELEMVAAELMRHDDRIEIQAFAGEAGDVSSDARRLSLRRGLNVRKFLVERGVLQSRIDVRALGGVRDNGPAERVDILLSRR